MDAIRELPAADRQIVTLHLEGLSAAEIEEVTGVSRARSPRASRESARSLPNGCKEVAANEPTG